MTGPAGGNNPKHHMTDGDPQAVDSFRAYLATLASLRTAQHRLDQIRDAARLHRQQLVGTSELHAVIEADDVPPADQTALRDRIAAALYDHSHPGWAISFPDLDEDQRDTYLARADAVLAVLPATTDQTADRAAIRAEVLNEQGPEDQETLADAAASYRWLRPVIEATMTDSDRWDGDESEEVHLGRYVQWLAAQAQAPVTEAQAERLATLTDCHGGTLHCEHYQEGDGDCCRCGRDNWCPNEGVAPAPLRRMADETPATETQDEAWQREWDRRPEGADVSDLFEITAVVPCSGTLFSAHQPHTWEPQPGVPVVYCPGKRQSAAGARQDGAQR
jgi:hypothetical protein